MIIKIYEYFVSFFGFYNRKLACLCSLIGQRQLETIKDFGNINYKIAI